MSVDLRLTSDTQEAVAELLDYASELGLSPSITSAYRTCQQQMDTYRQGRETPGTIVTWAQGCMSWHTHGRAVDLNLGSAPADYYRRLGEYWESMGGTWGGRFQDDVHFEWHPGFAIERVCSPPYTVCTYDPSQALAKSLRASVAIGAGMALVGVAAAVYVLLRK